MATYINYGEGEEDAVVQGADWLRARIAEREGPEAEATFADTFRELHEVESNKFDYYPIFELFMEHSGDLFDHIPEIRAEERLKEVESFYAVVFSTLLLFDHQEQIDSATKLLCKAFMADTTYGELRLRLLMMLYNTYYLPTLEIRYRVFKHVCDYAAKVGLFDQMVPYLEYLDNWIIDWEKHMTGDDKRELYRDLSKYMRDLRKPVDAFKFVKKYHLLFQAESGKILAATEVVEMTVQLLKDAVNIPTVIQFDDILGYATVKALGATKQHAELVNLCGVFLSGTVNDLRDFHGKNKKLFEQHGFSYDDALSKIRLLALATLAHGRAELSLDEVATALQEDSNNIERWVVRAISEGVIDGRIDQLERKVCVKSAFQRKFEKEEWAFLDSRLSLWIGNLENVIKFVGDQKAAKELIG